jgi:hypothetical protein
MVTTGAGSSPPVVTNPTRSHAMTEQIILSSLPVDLAAHLVDRAALIAPAAAAALDRYYALVEQIQVLEAAGITNASPFYRDEKYLYLVHPTAPDGSRQREYIGANASKQTAALARLDRYRQHQDLTRRANTQREKINSAAHQINILLRDLGGSK